jgi:glycosyltransferase involved in cell wall biosynthesis
MTLLEAMALGVPVVVTDVGAMAEVVRQAGCGIVVPPDDELALADALGKVLSDPALRDRLGRAGRAAATERYDCGRTIDDLVQVYEEVPGPRRVR